MAHHLGVRYQYAQPAQTADFASQPLISDLLAKTSAEWRYRLTQATLDLDDDGILSLAAQLPSDQQALAAAIKSKVNNLAYKTLLQVLQEAETVSP